MSQRTETSSTALYLLGFSESSSVVGFDASGEEEWNLLIQHEITFVESGSVRAWYKEIDREPFEGEAGEKNLSSLEWLTPRVLAHETVVSILTKHLTFYPARFGTLFSSERALCAFAANVKAQLKAFFNLVGTRSEWGVKFYGDMSLGAEIIAAQQGIIEEGKPTGGASYLKLRKMQRNRTEMTRSLFEDGYRDAMLSLHGRFNDIAARPLRKMEASDSAEELIGNVAVLSEETESQCIFSWATEWNQSRYPTTGLKACVSGPWPAYSFCPSLQSSDNRSEAA